MIPAISPGQGRRLRSMLILALIAASLLAAGCSSNSGASHDNGGSNSTEAHSNSDSNRETAESRLQEIGPELGTVLTDYRAGKKTQAYTLAKSCSTHLYEGTAEGIVSSIDPAVERQIDSLLATTLPTAIKNGDPVSQVAALVHQAQSLAASGLAAIHKSEH